MGLQIVQHDWAAFTFSFHCDSETSENCCCLLYMTKSCIRIYFQFHNYRVFLHGSAGNQSVYNAGDTGHVGLIPGLGRYPRRGNGKDYLLFISSIKLILCLINNMYSAFVELSWTSIQQGQNFSNAEGLFGVNIFTCFCTVCILLLD